MNNRGFTLLELILAVAVLSIILLGVGQLYFSSARYSKENDAQAFLQRQADIVVDEIARQVRAAKSLEIATCGGVANALKVSQVDPGNPSAIVTYCFYMDTSGRFVEGTPSGGTWNLLSGSPASLTVTKFDLCGTPPSGTFATCQTTGNMAYVSFQLQDAFQSSMQFTTTFARRN